MGGCRVVLWGVGWWVSALMEAPARFHTTRSEKLMTDLPIMIAEEVRVVKQLTSGMSIVGGGGADLCGMVWMWFGSFVRERGDMPSQYCMRLRKFLRGKPLDDVRQVRRRTRHTTRRRKGLVT